MRYYLVVYDRAEYHVVASSLSDAIHIFFEEHNTARTYLPTKVEERIEDANIFALC
jgi:hypothetical protein